MANIDKYGVFFSDDEKTLLECPKEFIGEYIIPSSVKCYVNGVYSATFPNSVTNIGGEAFKDCTGLTSVIIGNSVTSIGYRAFQGCIGLTSVVIGNSVTSIEHYAFCDCTSIISIVIPDSVTSIESNVFENCISLVSITIPNSVTNIENSVFEHCESLASVTIPDSVTRIGGGAFESCSSLVSITIPNSVTRIEDSAFRDCRALTSVEIPNSVTHIGNYAFDGCVSLPVVNHIRYAGTYLASIDNKSLTSYTIKDGTRWIGSFAFSYCKNLTSITIPNSVQSIGKGAFSSCSSLIAIIIPNSVLNIGNGAFIDCSKLTSITIPSSVTSIGDGVFFGCGSLTSIIWNAKNCADFAFMKTPFDQNHYETIYYIQHQITSITFGEEVEHIPAYLCHSMNKLTSIEVPNSVKSIGCYAFAACSGVKTMTIGNSVTNIGDGAFGGCTNITSITIPYSVKTIGRGAFSNCSSLNSINIPNSVICIGDGAFYGCNNLKEICVPKGQKARFAQMEGLKGLTDLIFERDNEELIILTNLAKAYEKGIGVTKSIPQAYLLYTQAAEKGSAESAYRLAEWYNEGDVIPRDLNKALNYFQQAAKSGYQWADKKAKEVQELINKEMQQMEEFLEEERHDRAKALQQREEAEQKKREDEDRKKRAEEERNRAYYLFFDTETSGLPPKGKYDASPKRSDIWPRLVQIAWLVTNKDGIILKQRVEIIYPAGFSIPPEATKIHGITTERARRDGKFIQEVLEDFEKDLSSANRIVCHNVMFDQHVLGAEMYRLKMDYEALMNKPSICTMLSSTNFCAIPNLNGFDDYKWPKLSELYHKLFNRDFDDAHDALADITATKDCFFELKRRGIL